jgi:hypothetical protein
MKLETLRSLRTMAGLPPLTVEEETAAKEESFHFGDASAQDEEDGRQSWYIEMFYGDGGHYSVVLYSDGETVIGDWSGPAIQVNSPLGQKIIDAARKLVGVEKTFTLEGDTSKSVSHTDAISEAAQTTANYVSFLQDLKKRLETDGTVDVRVKLEKSNIVTYSFR